MIINCAGLPGEYLGRVLKGPALIGELHLIRSEYSGIDPGCYLLSLEALMTLLIAWGNWQLAGSYQCPSKGSDLSDCRKKVALDLCLSSNES